MPGKQVLLLHSAISYSFPSYFTGGNGEPVAMSALPFVHSFRSLGEASWRRVGLESGKIMGRETWEAISWTISLVKDFGPRDICKSESWEGEGEGERTSRSANENVRFYSFDDREEIMAFISFPFGVVTCILDLGMSEFVALGL